MTLSEPVVRIARAVLPRSTVERLGALKSTWEQRSSERKLGSATDHFEAAYAAYWESGVVPPNAEELLFLAIWSSGGTFPQSSARAHARPYNADDYAGFDDDLLRQLDASKVARSVEQDGYYVAPFRLDDSSVDDILAVLDAGPAQPRGDGMTALRPGVPTPTAPTWWMNPSHSLGSDTVRRLLRERRISEVGGLYLGVDPMIMSVVLWKSFAWKSPDKNSAQQFHYDNDRASFIKMFVYLTDVGPQNGPHTYVPRSHRAKPVELLHGRRLSDEEVARVYPEEDWVTITGQKGTVFFADTRGFHKGGHVAAGERAMFQINVASDRFGVAEPPLGRAADAPRDLAPFVAAAPRFFSALYASERSAP